MKSRFVNEQYSNVIHSNRLTHLQLRRRHTVAAHLHLEIHACVIQRYLLFLIKTSGISAKARLDSVQHTWSLLASICQVVPPFPLQLVQVIERWFHVPKQFLFFARGEYWCTMKEEQSGYVTYV